MADMIGIATSGLLLTQRALNTTSHNIANVNTEGFSRQRVLATTQNPQFSGVGFIGNGARVSSIDRQFDQFLYEQVTINTSSYNRLETLSLLASQVDSLLADEDAGLSPALQEFFQSVQEVANDPSSTPARQAMISASQTLEGRFQELSETLFDFKANVRTQLEASVTDINSIASSIAQLNKNITLFSGSGAIPNDLLDQRNALITQLAEKVSVSTVEQEDGAVNVFIGNGQPLVLGTTAARLSVANNAFDPLEPEIAFTVNSGTSIATSQISGGELGGILDYSNTVLDPALNALGRLAIGLTEQFNDQHRLGMDLNGNVGGNFFQDITQAGNGVSGPGVSGNVNNTGTALLSATIADSSQLTISDYRIEITNATGPEFSVRRLTDSTLLGPFTGFPQTIDGFTLDVSSGTAALGDTFLVRPTRNGGLDFGVGITDTASIAAAFPLRTEANINNAGTGQISAGAVLSSTDMPLSGPVTLTFNSAGNQYLVSGLPGGATGNPAISFNPATNNTGLTAQIDIPTDSGASVAGFSFTDANGNDTLQYSLQINGTPIPVPVNGGGAGANSPNFTEGEAVPTLAELAAAINGLSGTTGVEAWESGGTLYFRNTAGNSNDIVIEETLSGATDGAADTATGFFGSSLTGANSANTITLPPTGRFTFDLSGVPQNGDTLTIETNTSGVGDNRNALALVALQTADTMVNGTTNFQDTYGQLVVNVGATTRQANISAVAQEVMLQQAQDKLSSVSGVNLDEEAANLLRYQQAYSAAAQVITIADNLFQTLIQAVNR